MTPSRFALLALLPVSCLLSPAQAGDWVHWRGPEQTGVSREKGLPDSFDPATPGKNNLLWRQPFGGRSAPLVLKGNLYTIGGYDMSLATEGERVMCFDAETGAKKWEKRFNVFHTDIVSSRLGWTTLTADPEAERIYCHTTGGFVICYDKDGNEVWKHSLTEEYGRITGYGGRIVSPIFDSGLCIVGMVSSSWGDHARAATRYVAFDGKTGEVVWWADTPNPIKGTWYSNPVIAVINGQRQLITGGADGYVHGFKVRTGERLWSYRFSAGVVNPSPVVDGNLVYITHGEENPEGGTIGGVVCLDVSKVDAKNLTPVKVWENKRLAKRFGLASPALHEGRLYAIDDAAEMVCFEAKTGKVLWRTRYGTVSRGAPLIADGKLYIFDVNAQLAVFKLKGNEEPDEPDHIAFRKRAGAGFVETHGTPIAVNGKLYFLTQDDLYCVGKPGVTNEQYKPLPPETEYKKDAAPVSLRLFPADVVTKPGGTAKFEKKYLDANGREVAVPNLGGEWGFVTPVPPKGSTVAPPPLDAELGSKPPAGPGQPETMEIKLGTARPVQQGYVEAKAGTMSARARVRVAGQIPFKTDFERAPLGTAPSGWVNAMGKFVTIEKDGGKVLMKVNTDSRPPFARANGYITPPNVSNYTIESDVMATEVAGKLPDMGVVNARYVLIMDGKEDTTSGKRQVRLVSWAARPRVNQAVDFEWAPNTWYRVKLTVQGDMVQGKVWKRGDAEPANWTVTYKDPSPNPEGAAALYGYVPNITDTTPGSEIFYDNVSITPNEKK